MQTVVSQNIKAAGRGANAHKRHGALSEGQAPPAFSKSQMTQYPAFVNGTAAEPSGISGSHVHSETCASGYYVNVAANFIAGVSIRPFFLGPRDTDLGSRLCLRLCSQRNGTNCAAFFYQAQLLVERFGIEPFSDFSAE